MKALSILAAAAVLLTGCAAQTAAPANDSPVGSQEPTIAVSEPSGPGTYAVQLDGAEVSLEIPAQADPESVAVLKLLGVSAGSWVKATVDNRQGEQGGGVSVVGLSTAEGKRVEYVSPDSLIDGMETSKLSTEDYNRVIHWQNAQNDAGYVEAGEKAVVYLAAPEALPEFVRVDAAKGTGTQAVKATKQ
ncbi:hypothetical protein [Sinomonas susongensis]|uniref:hypothetical protein n=1 Tax=Sinomonas susongensis TaxID=1324851 RepID=UPI001107F5FD|nr:hypothetical protein [Sinomonas susongensis]